MEQKLKGILSENITEACGCTEPAAIAYAAAIAAARVAAVTAASKAGNANIAATTAKVRNIKKITAALSANVIKNAHIVCLPGAGGRHGVPLALSLGALFGDPDKELNVIAGLTSAQIDEAERFSKSGAVEVRLDNCGKPLRITVAVEDNSGNIAEVTIAGAHTNICRIVVNGEIICDTGECNSEKVNHALKIEDIWNFAVSTDDFKLSQKIIEVNSAIAGEGLKYDYGMRLGRVSHRKGSGLEDKLYQNVQYILSMATAGTDARMAGADMPVMANSGSGNQGLTTSLPVIAAADLLGSTEDQKNRAVILSSLTAIMVKPKNKKLSAFCGAVTASAGVSAAFVYLCGGGVEQMKMALQNLLGNSFGMLCDGAKETCSLKVASCIFNAVYCAYLAMKSVYPKFKEGLVCESAESTIDTLARFCEITSDKLDEALIDIMLGKNIR